MLEAYNLKSMKDTEMLEAYNLNPWNMECMKHII